MMMVKYGMIIRFEDSVRNGGETALREVARFFMQSDPVFETLRGITQKLASLNVPYAVIGGMALVAHGYRRTTEDVDILVTKEGLDKVHKSVVGLGYVPLFESSRNLRDSTTGVRVEFVVTGQFPGDGKEKPVSFPSPEDVAVELDHIRYARLTTLVELKLASGMTNAGRLRDLADVQELIRVLKLSKSFAEQLNPYVRKKFLELAEGLGDDAGE